MTLFFFRYTRENGKGGPLYIEEILVYVDKMFIILFQSCDPGIYISEIESYYIEIKLDFRLK